ncbi:branched-chain amino acid transport system substrate-binding protein [Lachnospiraceae bacterium PF1-21]
MKNKKRLLSAALVAVMLVAVVAGCGKKDSGDSSSSEGSETFKIGGIGPLTGPAAVYGIAVQNGADLAVKEINEAGGINGKQVEFKMEDDTHDAEKAVNAYNTLKDWGMQMLMGTVTSDPCIAVEAEAEADNMFLITPSGTAVDCIKGGNAFRLCFSDPTQGIKAAEYIGEHGVGKKIGVIYDSSSSYSKGIYENFAKEADNHDLEVVAAEAFTADSNKDFTVQLKKIKDAGADVVFLPIYYDETALILKQAKDMEFDTTFFGCDGLDGLLSVEGFDTSLAEGVMLLTPFAANAEDELTKKFVADFDAAYSQTPIQFAADGYDAIYAIKAAAEEGGITPDMSASDICDALVTSMTKIELKGLTGTISWADDGEPDKEPKAAVIEGGEYVMK